MYALAGSCYSDWTECMHLQLSGCYLPPILSLLSHYVTLDIEQHTMQWRRPRVTGRWMLWLYAVVMTEVRRWLTAVQWFLRWAASTHQFQENMIRDKRVIAGYSDIENMSAGGLVRFPGNPRYCGGKTLYSHAIQRKSEVPRLNTNFLLANGFKFSLFAS